MKIGMSLMMKRRLSRQFDLEVGVRMRLDT